ncbi:MAG: hypothetical protein ABSF67_24040 [Roseiarcus sp.]|jgi:hypothetical protein
MKAMLRAAAALAWLAAAVCGASADARWATYVNDRFGTSLPYPADVFVMQPPPENDDGRTLVAFDGAKILVFGGYNVANDTLASKRASLTGGDYARIAYNATGKNWFVVSGRRAIGGVDSIFYEEYIVSAASETIHSLIVTYPAALKARYDPIVDRLAASFAGR